MLNNFFTKTSMNNREERWIEFFAHFVIKKINLMPGSVHALGEMLFGETHVMEETTLIKKMIVLKVEIPLRFKE